MDGIRYYIPSHLEDIFSPPWEGTTVVYNGVDGFPETCGGRVPENVKQTLLSYRQVIELSETRGPCFRLLANSCFPEYTPRVKELCRILDTNGSGIVVAREKFARALKQNFPGLRVSASCIMSLYHPFERIMTSPLFHTICAPQFWNNNTRKMIHKVPPVQRHRVHYIINSTCRWDDRHCRDHYERISKNYRSGPPERQPIPMGFCTRQKVAVSEKLGFELKKAGFTSFKFQGRNLNPDTFIRKENKCLGLFFFNAGKGVKISKKNK